MNVHADPPPTYEIDPEYVGSELSYVDMQVLSHMFREWALNEPNTSPEWATRLMLWSCDYDRLAEWFGVDWKPINHSTRMPLDKFLAEQQLRLSIGSYDNSSTSDCGGDCASATNDFKLTFKFGHCGGWPQFLGGVK